MAEWEGSALMSRPIKARLRWLAAAAITVVSLLSSGMVARATAVPPVNGGYQIDGLDAHDGKLVQWNGTYYLYGTRYGPSSSTPCTGNTGYHWYSGSTPWCGFGVWTSTNMVSWVYGGLLFDPQSANTASPIAPGESWQVTCTPQAPPNYTLSPSAGCFNPRMVQRGDGVWILWFNATGDPYRSSGTPAYYAMGCAGPAGPCGPGAGPNGSVHKPSLHQCNQIGDFDLVNDAGATYIVCTTASQSLNIEQLDTWWTNGDGSGQTSIAGLTNVESPSVFGANGYLFMTFSTPNCAYCHSDGTGWIWSSGTMLSTWTGTTAPSVSANSCSGQPRTVDYIDGAPYEWIDQWNGTDQYHSQALSSIRLQQINAAGSPYIAPMAC